LQAQDTAENDISEGSGNGLNGASETVRVVQTSNSALIAAITTDLTQDRDWSGAAISAESDLPNSIAFINNLPAAAGTAANFTMYVSQVAGKDDVYVCPSATGLAEVSDTCAGGYRIDSPTSVVVGSQNYYAIPNLTGGGIMGIEPSETFSIDGLPAGIVPEDMLGNSIAAGSSNGLNGAAETVRLRDQGSNRRIARVIVNLSQNRDWSGASISAGSDPAAGKAFVHNLLGADGVGITFTLYVPYIEGVANVYVCPGASSLLEVNEDCSDGYFVESPEIVTISGNDYYVLEELTGTGAVALDALSPEGGGDDNSGDDGEDGGGSLGELPRTSLTLWASVVSTIGMILLSVGVYLYKTGYIEKKFFPLARFENINTWNIDSEKPRQLRRMLNNLRNLSNR
ncbi:MAG: hypothetical protein ACOCXP_01390, partial [Candidatus Dojkabacteria bacterium]